MNIKKIKIEGAAVPWRLNQDELVEALSDLPIYIKGTRDLMLRASVCGGGIVRITPDRGSIIEYSLHNIRNSRIYPENGATYVLFDYHGVKYELGTASPFGRLGEDKSEKETLKIS